MQLTDAQLIDLGKTTLAELGRMKFNEIASAHQNYQFMKLLKEENVKTGSGNSIRRNIMVSANGNARTIGQYSADQTNVSDNMQFIDVPWSHHTTNYSYERREIQMNSDPARIVDLFKTRRAASMIDFAEHIEVRGWAKPASSSVSPTEPFGLPYWIVKNSAEGFNGGDPSGFSGGAGGLATASYPGWKNYSGTYSAITPDDLVAKMRKAHLYTNFQSPTDIPSYHGPIGDNYRIYLNFETQLGLEKLADAKNDNLGRDLAPMDGVTTFKKNPLIGVSALNSDTQNPVYLLNWNTFEIHVLEGEMLRESAPIQAPRQHTVFDVFVDLTFNLVCTNRRLNGVLYQA